MGKVCYTCGRRIVVEEVELSQCGSGREAQWEKKRRWRVKRDYRRRAERSISLEQNKGLDKPTRLGSAGLILVAEVALAADGFQQATKQHRCPSTLSACHCHQA